jgi:hypothetical protein
MQKAVSSQEFAVYVERTREFLGQNQVILNPRSLAIRAVVPPELMLDVIRELRADELRPIGANLWTNIFLRRNIQTMSPVLDFHETAAA